MRYLLVLVVALLSSLNIKNVEAQTAPGTDSTIRFSFRAAQLDGDPITALPAIARVRCRSLLAGSSEADYEVTVAAGNQTAMLAVASQFSPYRCLLTFASNAGAGSTIKTDSFDTAGADVDIYVFSKNRKLKFEVLDSNGDVIEGLRSKFSIATAFREPNPFDEVARPFIVDSDTLDPDTGRVQFNVVSNEVYRVNLRPGVGTSSASETGDAGGGLRVAFTAPNDKKYFVEKTSFLVEFPEPDSGDSLETSLVFQEADASIEVTLYDTDGETSIDGFASVFSRADGDLPALWTRDRIVAGQSLILPAVSGRRFRVEAGPTSQGDTVKFRPKPVFVTPEANENVVVNLELSEPNYTIQVFPKPQDGQGESVDISTFDFVRCFAYNARREQVSADELDESGAVSLSFHVNKRNISESFRVGCNAIASLTGESSRFFGEKAVRSKAKKKKGTIRVPLFPVGTSYPEQMDVVDATSFEEVVFPDGQATLDISPGAFASTGSVDLAVKTATEWQANTDAQPLDAWDIRPTKNDQVVETPSETVELCMPIDADRLGELGLEEDSVVLARFDEEEQQWITVPTNLVGESSARFACGILDHFSVWGTIVEVLEELVETVPTNFSVKSKANSKGKVQCTFKWDAPESEFAESIPYVVRYSKSKRKNQCLDLESENLTEVEVLGNSKLTVRSSRGCCGEVLIQESTTSTERKFRKKKKGV